MSIAWFRHWHGLATDPKLMFVAKRCRRPMCEVVAVFVCMLENASANEAERGTLRNWDHDVVGCSQDISPDHVEAIHIAMQGKLLLGNVMLGWSRRQPKREDDSADRVRAHRERKRGVTPCNAVKRTETPDSDSELELESKLQPSEQLAARAIENAPLPPEPVGQEGGGGRIASLGVGVELEPGRNASAASGRQQPSATLVADGIGLPASGEISAIGGHSAAASRVAALMGGVGLGGEPSVEARRKVCCEHNIADADPLVAIYRSLRLSRVARDPDASFIAQARNLIAKPGVRARCQPRSPPDLGIVAKPVRASPELVASLSKPPRGRHAHSH